MPIISQALRKTGRKKETAARMRSVSFHSSDSSQDIRQNN
jgi:hypothetical protein